MLVVSSVKKYFRKIRLKITKPIDLKKNINQTQLNTNIDLYEDRKNEFAEYYKITDKIIDIKKKRSYFENVSSDVDLLNDYIDGAQLYLLKLMVELNRYDHASRLIDFFNKKFKKENRDKLNVLDYGCGVADYGLIFALHGYHVVLCDIKNASLDFSNWRFKRRNLNCDIIPVTINNLYPEFKDLNIVVAGEVLEHLRDPLKAVKNIYDALVNMGYLWVSDFPFNKKKVKGGHLQEAADMRLEVLNFIKSNFNRVYAFNLKGYLLQKI